MAEKQVIEITKLVSAGEVLPTYWILIEISQSIF